MAPPPPPIYPRVGGVPTELQLSAIFTVFCKTTVILDNDSTMIGPMGGAEHCGAATSG